MNTSKHSVSSCCQAKNVWMGQLTLTEEQVGLKEEKRVCKYESMGESRWQKAIYFRHQVTYQDTHINKKLNDKTMKLYIYA
uniref:Ovule protein n=1 Tax=Heterorhabditis bacteriophora TaxID=37862 RepID=A0A1I7XSW8_HETBA